MPFKASQKLSQLFKDILVEEGDVEYDKKKLRNGNNKEDTKHKKNEEFHKSPEKPLVKNPPRVLEINHPIPSEINSDSVTMTPPICNWRIYPPIPSETKTSFKSCNKRYKYKSSKHSPENPCFLSMDAIVEQTKNFEKFRREESNRPLIQQSTPVVNNNIKRESNGKIRNQPHRAKFSMDFWVDQTALFEQFRKEQQNNPKYFGV